MNGNWAMLGWALPQPQFAWSAQFMSSQPVLPSLPQMPQNLGLPVPGQDLLPGAPYPDPGQTSYPAGAPSTASTSPGPPSVSSFPTTVPTRVWLQPKPLPSHVSDPPAFSLGVDQRKHAKAHSSQFQKSQAEVFPHCFPDAPAPVEKEAGSEGQEPPLPMDSRSAESGDAFLPPPLPTTHSPTSIPSTTAQPVTSTAPSPTTKPKEAKKPTEAENARAHICPHCGTSYSTFAFLDKHVHLCRQRPKEFPCPKCSSSFSRKHGLKAHVETVHCPPKHPCHICGKWFTKKASCTRHMRSQHSNSNPFKCSLCDYSTLDKSPLARHMSTHSSQKPFACPLCSASFAQNGSLKDHLNKAHSPGQSPLLCPHCGWAFAGKRNLSVHINSLHKES